MSHIELTLKRQAGESMGDFYDRLRIEARVEQRKINGRTRLPMKWAISPEWIENAADNTLTLKWPYSKS